MQHKSWLDRILDPLAESLDDLIALMRTRAFWAIVSICLTVSAFLVTAFIMLTNFNVMRMRNCFNASNMSTYLMFNTLMFFALGGMLAMGEAFNYFDNKKRGIPHKSAAVFWFVIITSTLGTVELILLKNSC